MSTTLEEGIKISNSSSRTVSGKEKSLDSIQLSTHETTGDWTDLVPLLSIWNYASNSFTNEKWHITLSTGIIYKPTMAETCHQDLVRKGRPARSLCLVFIVTFKSHKSHPEPRALRPRPRRSLLIPGWHYCLSFPPDFSKNAMTAFLVPEGVSMTARDVLTFKCLGSDYQHKKHFSKRKNKRADTLLITKLDSAIQTELQRKKRGVLWPGWRDSSDLFFYYCVSFLYLLLTLEILLPLVIGVSLILFPRATLISQPQKNTWVYIVTGNLHHEIGNHSWYHISCFIWHSTGSNRNYNSILQ